MITRTTAAQRDEVGKIAKARSDVRVKNLLLDFYEAIADVERLERELSSIDAVLARRPALDSESDRCAKIGKAIRVAAEADAIRVQATAAMRALRSVINDPS